MSTSGRQRGGSREGGLIKGEGGRGATETKRGEGAGEKEKKERKEKRERKKKKGGGEEEQLMETSKCNGATRHVYKRSVVL